MALTVLQNLVDFLPKVWENAGNIPTPTFCKRENHEKR